MPVEQHFDVKHMGSYPPRDVTFLLKDLNGAIEEQSTEERERAIQSGTHYSEMLPIEYKPTEEYMEIYRKALAEYAEKLAVLTGVVSEEMTERYGKDTVLVSLARAGTPVGILMKHFMAFAYGIDLPHYSISIIRGKGIDEQAIHYIRQKHPKSHIQFVDGWTGKGAISIELAKACRKMNEEFDYRLDDTLAVLADPGYCTDLYGTREDFLIPSACLNSTVSGLMSRTVHNEKYIHEGDFHGSKYYRHLENEDVSNEFIETIVRCFPSAKKMIPEEQKRMRAEHTPASWLGLEDIKSIQNDFGIEDINHVKPGVGETTRVLLRRVPWKILVKDQNDSRIAHIKLLAEDRGVPVEEYAQMSYTCCGLIKSLRR
ncbi:cysteine protease StiP family protein [Bacillus massiliglaciei]|uniref:cysteine protease StiP family protein n=1 Tax=Bacillus massiliglaciei TaxID=1816693 RepID=UPI000A5605B4|nr:cysteine protease StiP family protein [Bacillus massiliglaciei]